MQVTFKLSKCHDRSRKRRWKSASIPAIASNSKLDKSSSVGLGESGIELSYRPDRNGALFAKPIANGLGIGQITNTKLAQTAIQIIVDQHRRRRQRARVGAINQRR